MSAIANLNDEVLPMLWFRLLAELDRPEKSAVSNLAQMTFLGKCQAMRRSNYQQIVDWNKRQGGHRRLGVELAFEIEELMNEASALTDGSPKFLEFIPIRLVTTLEVFLRGVIAELIDEDEIFFERADKLTRGAKIDLAFTAHINRRELTVGDFVAHAVSLNNVDSIINTLDTLLVDFPAKLRVIHPRWIEEESDWPLTPIMNEYDQVMSSLARLYEVRHVLTHELPSSPFLDPVEVPALAAAAKSFITATDWVVVEALHGAVPRTQTGMNLNMGDELRDEEAQLAVAMDEATIGYARVSTQTQNLDRQIGALNGVGVERIYREKATAKTVKGRPQLERAIDALGTEDVLVIAEWDRATRSMMDGITIIQRVADRGATVKVLDKPWLDLTTPMGKGILAFLSALAEDERERITRRANEGRAAAKQRGVKFGPKPKLTEHQRSLALERLTAGDSCRAIARDMGVAHTTISRLR